jgi:ATP synthase protein I
MTEDESLSALRQRLNDAESARKKTGMKANHHARLPAEALALTGRIATEIVVGVIVGGGMGWVLDNWLGTSPLLMIVLFFLGAGAGMMNIWRMAKGHGLKIGYFDHQNKTVVEDDGVEDDEKTDKNE